MVVGHATIAALSGRALAGVSRPALMEEAIGAVVHSLGADCGVVFEAAGRVHQSLVVVAAECPNGSVAIAPTGRECPQAQYTFDAGGPVVVEDLRHETRFATADLLDRGVGSGVTAVITVDGAPYGVLAAYGTSPRRFQDDEVSFVQSTANVLGMAVERQRHSDAGLSTVHHERWASVGQLAAGFAHEFDNILAAITLYADILDTQHGLDHAGRSHVDAIRQQALSGASLVWQLRDCARERPLQMGTIEMGTFVDGFLPQLRHTLPVGVRLTVRHDAHPYLVTADTARVQRMFLNLVSSAGHAIDGPGEVRITLTRPNVGCSAPVTGFDQPFVCIDIGAVCAPVASGEQRTTEPIFRAGAPREGSGRPHALAGLISEDEGRIEVVTNRSDATGFRLWLPIPESPDISAPALPFPVGAGESVLVVDDDPAMRCAIARVLELLGYGAIAVGSGEEAISVLETTASSIPIVLSDAVMPGMGGEALAHLVSDRWPGTAVILASGFPAPGELVPHEGPTGSRGAAESPVWLQKPFTSHQMAAAINAARRST